MEKIKLFTMQFTAPGTVELYEDNGGHFFHIATMQSVEAAREYARTLCPDGYRMRLTSTARPI